MTDRAAQRTTATHFFGLAEVLSELEQIKFAVSSIIQQYPNGSYERETAMNAAKGIAARLDYLHDSVSLLRREGTGAAAVWALLAELVEVETNPEDVGRRYAAWEAARKVLAKETK